MKKIFILIPILLLIFATTITKNSTKNLDKKMHDHAANLEFEEAASLRDEIRHLEATELGLIKPGIAPKAAWRPKNKGKKRQK